MSVFVLSHPLVATQLSLLRDKSNPDFYSTLKHLSRFLCFESTRNLSTKTSPNESPLSTYNHHSINHSIAIFPILRAGLGLLDGFRELLPGAPIHLLGLYREKESFLPVEYYNKLPTLCNVEIGYIVDPMIATAGTVIAAIQILKDWGCKKIIVCCVVASEDGLKNLKECHDDVDVYCCSVDGVLTQDKYILPGLGDAGDRLFNTFH